MKRDNGAADPELEMLLERGRIIRPVPDVVRARALARARAHMGTAAATPPEAAPVAPTRSHRFRFALAASLAMIAGAAGAAAALYNHAQSVHKAAEPAKVRVTSPARVPDTDSDLPTTPAPAPSPPAVRLAKPARPSRPLTPQESYAAELDLLQRAQAASAAGKSSLALALVAEHGRQFPNGRLAEEREALRVKSLAAAGRMDEARRAAATFATRFPRSVLLPRLQETAKGAE